MIKSIYSMQTMDHFTSDIDPFHATQKHVIIVLRNKEKATYSELQPEGMSGNAFNYHFKQLVANKLVAQNTDATYSLTRLGRLTEDSISSETFRFKLRPVLGVWLVVHSKEHGYLLYKSDRQPIRGFVGLPFGKVVLGNQIRQSVEHHIKKRYLDESKLTLTKQIYANIRYFEGKDLVSHRSGGIWFYEYNGEATLSETSSGHAFWSHQLPKQKVLIEVASAIDSDSNFLELTQDLLV